MTVNIDLNAASAISAALYGKDMKIESADFFDDFREEAIDNVGNEVDSACTYYTDCMEIIRRYESEYGAEYEDTGETFKAEDWQQAMVRYAAGIADCAIRAAVEETITEIEDGYMALCESLIDDPAFEDDEPVAVAMATECIHGWAAHARETVEGILVWHRLDGDCEARAIKAGGFWLSVTWTPEKA